MWHKPAFSPVYYYFLPLISQRSKYYIFCIDTHIE